MDVLILANYDVGLYQFRKELIQELLKDHDVTISLPYGDLVSPLIEIGCGFLDTPVDRRGINPVTDLKLFLCYGRMLRKVNPDLVMTYTIKPNIYGGLACRLAGIPYAANITGLGTAFQKQGLLRELVVTMYKLALKKAKVVFFENCENLETLVSENIVRREQCKLLNGAGVNLEHYSPAPYPMEANPVRFLFMGRVMAEKGVNELFEAMRRLRADGIDCTLDVLGNYEEHYEEVIKSGEAEGWLRYHGYQQDVRPFIEMCHCFVLPSWHEGMANTNLECAAMARPVITSRIHGCMEAVIEGKSGFLCKVKNTDSLYGAMRSFCLLSPEQRKQMGLAGRRHMEDVFDKKLVVEETMRGLGL